MVYTIDRTKRTRPKESGKRLVMHLHRMSLSIPDFREFQQDDDGQPFASFSKGQQRWKQAIPDLGVGRLDVRK
jgi:hypothetical protein